jgi:hypothetical protein
MNNAVFWVVALCRYCVKGRFGGKYHLHLQGRKSAREEPTAESAATCSSWFVVRRFFYPED